MNVAELYRFLDERMPTSLACDWDHDGLAVCPDERAPVRRVLCVLDVTAAAVERAKNEGYDVILTHHPLLFHPLYGINDGDLCARLVRDCLLAGVSVMNFHTRCDAVEGGVNDCLLAALGLTRAEEPAPGQLLRVGTLPAPLAPADFAALVAEKLNARVLRWADGGRPVSRVGVVGGGGRDDYREAMDHGCDAYLTGETGHHLLTDAPGLGLTVVEAGHYETERPVLGFLASLVRAADPAIAVTTADITPIRFVP